MKLFKENFKFRGIFKLKVYENGTLIEEYEDDNLVVNTGRSAIMRLLGEGDDEKQVTQIAFGTNGAAPLLTDTALTNQFKKNISSYSYPAVNSLQLNWSLETSEANGTTIREFGLFCADDTLFARKIRASIEKTDQIRIEGTWTIVF